MMVTIFKNTYIIIYRNINLKIFYENNEKIYNSFVAVTLW